MAGVTTAGGAVLKDVEGHGHGSADLTGLIVILAAWVAEMRWQVQCLPGQLIGNLAQKGREPSGRALA